VHSSNHCCCGKAKTIYYFKCLFVALVVLHAKRMHYHMCYLWSVWLYHSFLQYLINSKIFFYLLLKENCVIWLSLQRLSEAFFILRRTEWHSINVQTSSCKVIVKLFCQILMKLEFSRQMFEKHWNINLHKNLSTRNRVFLCGQTNVSKPVIAFRNFANAPKSLLTMCATADCLVRNNLERRFYVRLL
jgi:hypothetical protein